MSGPDNRDFFTDKSLVETWNARAERSTRARGGAARPARRGTRCAAARKRRRGRRPRTPARQRRLAGAIGVDKRMSAPAMRRQSAQVRRTRVAAGAPPRARCSSSRWHVVLVLAITGRAATRTRRWRGSSTTCGCARSRLHLVRPLHKFRRSSTVRPSCAVSTRRRRSRGTPSSARPAVVSGAERQPMRRARAPTRRPGCAQRPERLSTVARALVTRLNARSSAGHRASPRMAASRSGARS